ASTGTPSHFLNPADAVHGDLGSVRPGDVVLLFSASGESEEIVRLLGLLKRLDHPVIAVTANYDNSLGQHADVVIPMGKLAEACSLKLAPSCSTTAMLALGDALALTVSRDRRFSADDFAVFHPAGQLGRKLMTVAEAMTFKPGANLPFARADQTVAAALHEAAKITRRPGAIVIVDDDQKLVGIFSDGDLRRLLDGNQTKLHEPIGVVMTRDPKRVRSDDLAAEAMAVMRKFRVDELPVVDADGRCVGLIDVQDLVVLRLFDVEPTPPTSPATSGKDA
ncbi:MAG: KpsF/GutQ family sugar-phosphate isomerase, partial [Planctomycetota bacterium]